MPMTTIPTLREALAKAREATFDWGNTLTDDPDAEAAEIAAWAAVDQALEALAGPDAGEAFEQWEKRPDENGHSRPINEKWRRYGRAAYEAGRASASIPQPEPAAGGWRDIASAPRDGTPIILLSAAYDVAPDRWSAGFHVGARVAIGQWNSEGSAWVDQHGRLDGDAHHLETTGTWSSEGAWFQPNEVTHWQPLPAPPFASSPEPEGVQ